MLCCIAYPQFWLFWAGNDLNFLNKRMTVLIEIELKIKSYHYITSDVTLSLSRSLCHTHTQRLSVREKEE